MLPIPPINQLDGSENATENCVAAGVAEWLAYYGVSGWTTDRVKDTVYGGSYHGPQDIRKYVPFLGSHGILVRSVVGTPDALVSAIQTALAARKPVMGTIPSNWNADPPPQGGSTHAIVFVGPIQKGTSLVADNPWRGFRQTELTAWWKKRLRTGMVWIAERKVVEVKPYTVDDKGWGVYPNGVRVGPGVVKLLDANNITELPVLGTTYAPWLNGNAITVYPSHLFVYEKGQNQTTMYSGIVAGVVWLAYQHIQADEAALPTTVPEPEPPTDAPGGAAESIAAVSALWKAAKALGIA